AAAAAGYYDEAAARKVADGVGLEDRLGLRAGDDATPAAAGVLADCPVVLRGERLGARLFHVRADRLGGIGEGRIVAIDDRQRDDRDRLAGDAAAPELVAQRLDEHVADRALDVGAGIVHRHWRHLGKRELRAA